MDDSEFHPESGIRSASISVHYLADLFGANEQEIIPNATRRRNTLTFILLGSAVLFMFGLLSFAQEKYRFAGYVDMMEICFLMLPAFVLTSKAKHPVWAEFLLVVAGFLIFSITALMGGHSGSGAYWAFVFPYLVFFLRGQKIGWIAGVAFAILVPILMDYSANHWNFYKYDRAQAIYFGFAFLFNVITAANFNLLRSNYQSKLWKLVEFNTGEVNRHLKTLRFNNTHDPTTGLRNRQGVISAIEDVLTIKRGEKSYLLVVCISFFRIPELASIVGMDKVDEPIGQLAKRLRKEIPDAYKVGRPAQDRLAILLLKNTQDLQAVEAIRKIREMTTEGDWGEFSVHVEYSFGVAIQLCTETLPGREILRKAEQALLYAIDNSLEYRFYDTELSEHFVKRNIRYEKLRDAVYSRKLCLHYQPQVNLATGQVFGAEALARWEDSKEGMISPAQFIPILESTGLLRPFTVWSVFRAVEDCASWQYLLPGVTVSINLSAEALMDQEVMQAIENALKEFELNPQLVMIELTESVLVKQAEKALANINRLTMMGLKLSIDDYGAGFSSLTYLKQLPAHEMKIDMSFIRKLSENDEDQAIVNSSIKLGHDLQFQVLAEGIEDAKALEFLKDARCDLGQGWYFSKALPLEDFVDWSLTNLKRGWSGDTAPAQLLA